ncbi:hypothetical protein BDN67DRAFT_974039 [Paxillus ammoniavirescens]|nr:hypothetical protein BDN67DRAFT_974039 [Paxillus ammoniavirescens]
MSSRTSPPEIPSVPTGPPAQEWANATESILSSESVKKATGGDRPTDEAMGDVPAMTATKLVTPELELPGSYPKELNKESELKTDSDSKDRPIGASVVHAAKQYMPQVERGVEYAGQTAVAYLPIPQNIKDTVVSYWSSEDDHREGRHISTSLPSTELKGAQPSEHTGGVGSLPGSISESSVALLPDEREERDQAAARSSGTPQKETPRRETLVPVAAAAAVPVTRKDESRPHTQEGEQQGKDVKPFQVSKPSKDEPILPPAPRSYADRAEGTERLPATVGVKDDQSKPDADYQKTALPEAAPPAEEKLMQEKLLPALPGPPAESRENAPGREGTEDQAGPGEGRERKTAAAAGVGMLGRTLGKDEDREGPHCPSDDITQAQKPQEATISAGSLKEAGREKGETHRQEEKPSHNKQASGKEVDVREEGKTQKHTTSPQKAGYGGDYHPAQLHPPPLGASASETSPNYLEQAPPALPTSPTSKEGSQSESTAKKVGFMAKVKGEVKVLAGKITREDDKVDAGKKLMHGEVQK